MRRACRTGRRKRCWGAFGLFGGAGAAGALLTGLAVLTLLSNLCEDRPLLVVADDAQWMDRGSLDTLAFAARRLEAEPLVLLLGTRGNLPPAGFERDFPELRLEPLNIRAAGRLLDAQPHPPRGRAREQVLAQAAGNPIALIELSRIIAADPAAGRRWASRAAAAHRPARRHHRRSVRRPPPGDTAGAAARPPSPTARI